MATLEKIRRRSGLLLIIIGLAILAFILTDLLRSGNSIFRADANVVGRVNGETIEINEFQKRMAERRKMVEQQNPQQAGQLTNVDLAEAIWNDFLKEQVLYQNLNEQGFAITPNELLNRVKNNPTIQNAQAFKDPQTGQFSEFQFSRYLSNMEERRYSDAESAEAYKQWVDFEQAIKDQALTTKYYTAVSQGIYTPRLVAKAIHERKNTKKTVAFTGVEYTTIADEEVEITERDLKRYYNAHKHEYKAEETRGLAFVNINIQASQSDRSAIKKELRAYLTPQIELNKRTGKNDTLESFANAENDSLFAAGRSDRRVMGGYTTLSQIKPPLDSGLFEKPVGYIKGPYENQGYYAVTKIADIKSIPDSVEARHILISYAGANNGQSQSQRSPQQARALADSLFAEVQADTSKFAELARANSDDPGSGSRGGNLGTFGQGAMVPAFNNFCFYNEEGDVGMVFSQFGIHIIEVLHQKGENKGLKLFTISREIVASEATIDSVYNEASSIASQAAGDQNLADAAAQYGYNVRPVDNIKPFEALIPGIGNNREIVRWAFDGKTEVGQINLFNNKNESYAVVMLINATDEGTVPFEDIKERLRPATLIDEKAKILEKRVAEILEGGADNVTAVAQKLGTSVVNQEITFSTATLTDYGAEPAIVGALFALEEGAMSKAIQGDRAVYVGQVNEVKPYAAKPSYAMDQSRLQGDVRRMVSTAVYDALVELANIEDNRPKFY